MGIASGYVECIASGYASCIASGYLNIIIIIIIIIIIMVDSYTSTSALPTDPGRLF